MQGEMASSGLRGLAPAKGSHSLYCTTCADSADCITASRIEKRQKSWKSCHKEMTVITGSNLHSRPRQGIETRLSDFFRWLISRRVGTATCHAGWLSCYAARYSARSFADSRMTPVHRKSLQQHRCLAFCAKGAVADELAAIEEPPRMVEPPLAMGISKAGVRECGDTGQA